jgi:hydroxyacid-oxoacid transhydrogenase
MEKHVKTSIVSPAIRPVMGILDPNNIRTQPKMVAASCGLDVLTHALESLTAVPFTKRPAPENPLSRPTYQGANPISHMWASRAIEMVSRSILRATEDPSDDEALSEMILAAAFAGIGFGNAGVHLPHAMSYPVSGMVRDYIPEGYPKGHPIIPHGMCVALHAPASFRFTAQADPDMHHYAARLMGVDTSGVAPENAGELLGGAIADLMRKLNMPNGLSALGFGPEDLDELVEGALYLKRFIVLAPRLAEAEDLRQLFQNSLKIW